MVLLALPLIVGRVPRNRWYGVRTDRTMSDDAVWYPVNRTLGWSMLVIGAGVLLLTAAWFAGLPAISLVVVTVGLGLAGPVTLGVIARRTMLVEQRLSKEHAEGKRG